MPAESSDSIVAIGMEKYDEALALINRFEKALSSCDSSLKYDPGDSTTVELRSLIIEDMELMNQ